MNIDAPIVPGESAAPELMQAFEAIQQNYQNLRLAYEYQEQGKLMPGQ
jgi:hypothetical protein